MQVNLIWCWCRWWELATNVYNHTIAVARKFFVSSLVVVWTALVWKILFVPKNYCFFNIFSSNADQAFVDFNNFLQTCYVDIYLTWLMLLWWKTAVKLVNECECCGDSRLVSTTMKVPVQWVLTWHLRRPWRTWFKVRVLPRCSQVTTKQLSVTRLSGVALFPVTLMLVLNSRKHSWLQHSIRLVCQSRIYALRRICGLSIDGIGAEIKGVTLLPVGVSVWERTLLLGMASVSYTHLTLPTNREV